MTDILDRFAAVRPPTAADDDWADSAAGRMALVRIHHRAVLTETPDQARVGRPRWLRRAVAVSAAILVVGGATAAAVVISRDPNNPALVVCMRTASPEADGVGLTLTDPTPAAALQACSSRWVKLFPGDKPPNGFAVCVYPVSPGRNGELGGGGQVVIPAAKTSADSAAACTAAGFVPIATS